MKALALLSLLLPLTAAAAPEAVNVARTACARTVQDVLKRDYTKFEIVNEDGEQKKIGSEFVDLRSLTALPTLNLMGMDSDKFFGLVGYTRINYMGHATSHLYTYVVSATCQYNAEAKEWQMRDVNFDGQLDKSDLQLQEIDFDRG